MRIDGRPGRAGAGMAALVALAAVLAVTAPAPAATYSSENVAAWRTTSTGLVRDFTTIGTTAYVGGSFVALRATAGATSVPRTGLGALDATTGALSTTFVPNLDGEVRSLVASPDGTMLFAGGTFRTVDGVSRRGLAALDPATGRLIASFDARLNGDVLDLASDGEHLYAVGRFWTADGHTHEKVTRISLATLAVDHTWSPQLRGGTAVAVAVDRQLDRVYLGGFFTSLNDIAATEQFVAVHRGDGTHVGAFDPRTDGEVYDIAVTPARVWTALGGIGGRVEAYATGTGARDVSWFGDGDIQVLEPAGSWLYVGGHHETGLGSTTHPFLHRVDVMTGQVDLSFTPNLTARTGFGVWGLHATPAQLWVGGAITAAAPVDAVGLTRYPLAAADPPDLGPPTAPLNLRLTARSDVSVELAWDGATDDSGLVSYVVERDGAPIGSSLVPRYVDTTAAANTTYTYSVRAVDRAGLTAATPVPLVVTTMPVLNPVTAVALGDTWRYLDSGPAPDAGWNTLTFDDRAWPAGPAELGAGDGDEATLWVNRPVNYVRRDVVLASDAVVGLATFSVRRDDGVVVYVNGTEVLRSNLPTGPVNHTTAAVTSIFGMLESEVLTFTVDPNLFVAGRNVIAASVHNATGSTDSSFAAALDLRVGTTGVVDTEAPTAPANLQGTAVSPTEVSLAWEPATDNVGVVGYRVIRDGLALADLAALGLTDATRQPGTTASYEVVAYDSEGNVSAPATVDVTTPTAPPPPLTAVSRAQVWRYYDAAAAPPGDWPSPSFADATWAQGAAELGAGDGDEATVIVNRPVAYFRTSFDLADPTGYTELRLELLADDGAVVYLNGVELLRDNVAAGPVTHTTPAATYRSGSAERRASSFVVPASALVAGPNVVAVSLHNGPGSTDCSFSLQLVVV